MGSLRRASAGGNRFGFNRRQAIIPTRPIVVIVCDDTKTAPAYFTALKLELKERVTIKVVKAPCKGASPQVIVERAVKELRELRDASSHDSEDAPELIWVVIDLEAEPAKRAQAIQVGSQAPQDISIARSDPCFEVWTLAHLADTGEMFEDCAAVLARVKIEWKRAIGSDFGKKSTADYSKLMPFLNEAVERAKKRTGTNNQSWTEVWKVIEAIGRFRGPS